MKKSAIFRITKPALGYKVGTVVVGVKADQYWGTGTIDINDRAIDIGTFSIFVTHVEPTNEAAREMYEHAIALANE